MIKVICPSCKKEYNLPEMYIGETITCAGCKNKIKVTDQGAIGTNQAKCPYCFSTVPAGAKKCLNCGEWLSPNSKPKSRAVYILLTFWHWRSLFRLLHALYHHGPCEFCFLGIGTGWTCSHVRRVARVADKGVLY